MDNPWDADPVLKLDNPWDNDPIVGATPQPKNPPMPVPRPADLGESVPLPPKRSDDFPGYVQPQVAAPATPSLATPDAGDAGAAYDDFGHLLTSQPAAAPEAAPTGPGQFDDFGSPLAAATPPTHTGPSPPIVDNKGNPIPENGTRAITPEEHGAAFQQFDKSVAPLKAQDAAATIQKHNAAIGEFNTAAAAIEDGFKKTTAGLDTKVEAQRNAYNTAVTGAKAQLDALKQKLDQQTKGLDVEGASARLKKYNDAYESYQAGLKDLAAQPAPYGDDSLGGRVAEAWTRMKEGATEGAGDKPLGFTPKEIAAHPWLALPQWQWPAQAVETLIRGPGAVIGALSGAAAGGARIAGADTNIAGQVGRATQAGADFLMTPGAHPGGIPNAFKETPLDHPANAGRPAWADTLGVDPSASPEEIRAAYTTMVKEAAKDPTRRDMADIVKAYRDAMASQPARNVEGLTPKGTPPDTPATQSGKLLSGPTTETASPAAGRPEPESPISGTGPETEVPASATGPAPGGGGRATLTADEHLRARGWPDEDIADMNPSEKAATLKRAGIGPDQIAPATEAPETEAPKAGTRAAPIKVETPEDVRAAEQHVDPDPTPAQMQAENYQHGHVTYEGLPVSIETAKGGTRRAPDGSWEVKDYPATYGRIKGSESSDGEAVDIFIGDKPPNGKVFIIHQHDPETGAYDEPKAVTGVNSLGEAVRLYGKAYPNGAHLGRIGNFEELTTDEFKQRLKDGAFKKPPQPDAFDAAFDAGQDHADTIAQAPPVDKTPENSAPVAPAPAQPAHSTPWADATPGDTLVNGTVLVRKGILRRRDATDLARQVGGTLMRDGATKFAVVGPQGVKIPELPRQSLVQYLRKMGGIKDSGGELKARNTAQTHPFLVNNKSGMSLDEARQAAAEAGYLQPPHGVPDGMTYTEAAMADTTTNHLLEALDNHPTYPAGELPPERDQRDTHAETKDILRANMRDIGVPDGQIDEALLDAAATIAENEGLDPDHAYEAAIFRSYDNAERAEADLDDPIPWEDYGPPAAGAAVEDRPSADGARGQNEGPGAQGEVPAGREEHSDPGDDEARPQSGVEHGAASEVTTEPGAEGKPQTVIPGAEQISKAEQAQRGADKGLKPKVPQKDVGGLFGDSMDQKDLLDAVNEKPQTPSTPTASWVIREKGTGKVIAETFEKKTVDALNKEKYEAVPIQQHLAELNEKIKADAAPPKIEDSFDAAFDAGQDAADVADPRIKEREEFVETAHANVDRLRTKAKASRTKANVAALHREQKILQERQAALDAARKAAQSASEPALRPSGATVIRYPSGRYGFVGKVPDELAFVEGSTPEQIKAGKQFGARFGAKTTVFDSAQAAVDYARERGLSVNVVDAAGKPATPPDTRPTKDVAASAVKNAIGSADDALSALSTMFNSKGRPGSGFTFDEDTYAKAKPLFARAAEKFRAFLGDVAELVKRMVVEMRQKFALTREGMEAMRPYLRRFMDDLKAGKVDLGETDAPSAHGGLEPDRGTAAAGDRVGPTDVPAAPGRNGTSPRARGEAPGRGRDGGGLPESHAPVVGEGGNLELPERSPGPALGAADPDERGGGVGPSEGGLPEPDRTGPAEVEATPEASAGIAERIAAQANASTDTAWGDPKSIDAALPLLFPEQRDDVRRTEQRFIAEGAEPGMMLTNGTGTGKTFSGLGVIKRFVNAGKDNVLVVAPSQGILSDWVKSAKLLGLDMQVLDSTKTHGGKGVVATTYANLGQNRHLADRDWHLVVTDEAHKLTQGESAPETSALRAFRGITMHPNGIHTRAEHQLRDLFDRVEALPKNSEQKHKAMVKAIEARDARVEEMRQQPRPKALFLSATPFAYHFSLDYAEGYLYSHPPKDQMGGYNAPNPRDAFYMQHFGYRKRYNKLTKPDANVQSEIMERQFHEYLKKQGSLWGRALEVDKDYDRKFVLAHDAVGTQIDSALSFLAEADDGKFRILSDLIGKKFDYLSRMRLLEAMKARAAVPYIEQSLALGRKVVVFHDYNEGGGFNPFDLQLDPSEETTVTGPDGKPRKVNPHALYQEFLARNPYVAKMRFSDYRAPIAELTAHYPDALIYNGTIPNKVREEAKRLFNDDTSGRNIIIVQSAAGEAGISLHDTTGNHQRTLLNLGMPIRPTTAIQQEGRIYRVGQASDALFRYMNTGTNWERWTFAGKIAERAGTAENLALGNQARTIRQSFVESFANTAENVPTKGEGRGGKAADKALTQNLSEFEQAKSHYYAQQKQQGRRDQRAGVDYFPTPEPLGLKMVEWAGLKPNERVLEPSAGHGAIARFFPEDTHKTLVEPSNDLASLAALRSPGARVLVQRFEDLHANNKYDAIVMNPPFGTGGKTAIEHLEKAMSHLANGGRIVALIPEGQGRTRFDKLMESEASKGVYMTADIQLPAVTFERAGTGVRSFIAVLDKQTEKQTVGALPHQIVRKPAGDTIGELFDNIENLDVPQRIEPITKEPVAEPAETAEPDAPSQNVAFDTHDLKHTKTGAPIFVAAFKTRVPLGIYTQMNATAKANGGYYSSYKGAGAVPGFVFKTPEARAAFLAKAGGSTPAAPRRADASAPADPMTLPERRHADAVMNIASNIINSVLPPGSVRLSFPHHIPITDAEAASSGSPGASHAAGLYTAEAKLMEIAQSARNGAQTAYHEGWHAVRDLDLMTPEEKAGLADPATQAQLRDYAVRRFGPERARGMHPEELEAYAIGDGAEALLGGKAMPHLPNGILRRMAYRLGRILRRLSDWMMGLPKHVDLETIIKRYQKGEFAKRSSGGAKREPPMTRSPMVDMPYKPEGYVDRLGRKLAKIRDVDLREQFLDISAKVQRLEQDIEAKTAQTMPAENSLYHAKRMIPGRVAAEARDIEAQFVRPWEKALKDGGLNRADMDNYLLARGAPDRNALMDQRDPSNAGRGSGIDDTEAADIMAQLAAEGKIPALKAAAKWHDALVEKNRERMVESGLLSAAQAAEWKQLFPNYMDLSGFDDPDLGPEERERSGGGKLGIKGKEAQHALGRNSIAGSPTANALAASYRAITRAERNVALNTGWQMFASLPQALRDDFVRLDRPKLERKLNPQTGMVELVPESRFGPNSVPLKIGGKQRYMTFESEKLAQAVDRMAPDALPGALKMIQSFNNLRKFAWTHVNPEFLIGHFLSRYPIEGALNAGEHGIGAMGRSFKGYPGGPAFRAIRKVEAMGEAQRQTLRQRLAANDPTLTDAETWQAHYIGMRDAGGLMDFRAMSDLDTLKARMDRNLQGMSRNPAVAAMHFVRNMGHLLDAFTSAMDNAQRLAAYREAIRRGETPKAAALAARDATVDFALRGRAANGMSIWRAFFNTGVQTGDRLVRGMKRSGRFRKVVYATIGLGIAQAIFNYLSGGSDDKGNPYIEKVSDYTRRTKFTLHIPGLTDSKGEPYFFTAPFPYGFMAGLSLGNLIGGLMMKATGTAHDSAGKMVAEAAHAIIEAFVPIGQESTWLGQFTPDFMLPYLHVATNTNAFGGPVHTSFPKAGLARAEQGRQTTGEPWGAIAHGLNSISGGDKYHHGWLDTYPEDYRETLGELTSSLERIVSRGGAAAGAEDGNGSLSDIPGLHVFLSGGPRQYDAADRARFFEQRNALKEQTDAVKQAKKQGDTAAAAEMSRGMDANTRRDAATADRIDKERTKINKQRNEIINSRLPEDQKQQKLDRLNTIATERMRRLSTAH